MLEKITKKAVDKVKQTVKEETHKTTDGNTLCLEPVFGTYYWSDISAVKRAYAEFFDMYVHSQQVYMEDLYNLLHIPVRR